MSERFRYLYIDLKSLIDKLTHVQNLILKFCYKNFIKRPIYSYMDKLERCLDCSDSKSILIGVHNHGLFGDKIYLCEDCYDLRYGENYFLKREKTKRPSYLKLVKF